MPELEGWISDQLTNCPILDVTIEALSLGYSPRGSGEDSEHTRSLAEVFARLPPILVHGPSCQVIDGFHRVRAALLRGENRIRAIVYSGTREDAFVLSVRLNIDHGLPLSRADRMAAARRIMASHIEWSDRMLGTVTGLSPITIAGLRRSTEQNEQSNIRIGRDGRARPIDITAGRLRAREFLARKPMAPIREIAQEAGISVSTAGDVRRRVAAGLSPLPEGKQARQSALSSGTRNGPMPSFVCHPSDKCGDAGAVLDALRNDPSVERTGPGQFLLRLMDMNVVCMTMGGEITGAVPENYADAIAEIARQYARMWDMLATQLQKR